MNIKIGENIKHLRQEKNITQEKLAEYLNISAPAISKWERSETLPDITLLFPLASLFDVTLDELMGYNAEKIKESVRNKIQMYHEMNKKCNFREAKKIIFDLHKENPNNFEVTLCYIWHLIGGSADNSKEVLLKNADEIIHLCEQILDECTVNSIRLDATDILAKVYYARGNNAKATACFEDFPSFYQAKGQKLEQLYEKDTEEFRKYVNQNMLELLDFAFNKVGKVIWYSGKSVEERDKSTCLIADSIESYIEISGYKQAYSFLACIYHEGGKVLNMEEHYDKAGEYYMRYLECRELQRGVKPDLEWIMNTPFLKKLREHEVYAKIIEKFK